MLPSYYGVVEMQVSGGTPPVTYYATQVCGYICPTTIDTTQIYSITRSFWVQPKNGIFYLNNICNISRAYICINAGVIEFRDSLVSSRCTLSCSYTCTDWYMMTMKSNDILNYLCVIMYDKNGLYENVCWSANFSYFYTYLNRYNISNSSNASFRNFAQWNNRELTDAEVSCLWNGGCPYNNSNLPSGLTTNLYTWINLNGSANQLCDYGSGANNAVCYPGTTLNCVTF